MFAQRSVLDRLPNELLALIRNSFYKYDLVGHINLYRLTPRTASLYPAADDPFWEKLCYMNGLGRLPIWEDDEDDDGEPEPLDWFRIAFECGCHALTCTHSACGRARLEENAKLMAAHFNDISADIIPVVITGEDEETYASASTIFEHVTFQKEDPDNIRVRAFLRTTDDKQAADLAAHPIVQRSFASLPPVNGMQPFGLTGQPMRGIEGKYGVTVDHVLRSLCTTLAVSLSVRDAIYLFERVHSDEVFPQSWATERRLDALKHLVDWFDVVDWKGFEAEECSYGMRHYSWVFEANPEALLGRAQY